MTPAATKRKARPVALQGITYEARTGCGPFYITINESETIGREVLTTMGKSGGCASAQCEALGKLVSLAYLLGASTDDVAKEISGIICHQPFHGDADFQKSTSCSDALAGILRIHDKHKNPK